MYDEGSKCYTPHNLHDFCGFECRYNELTERYDVNGLASSTFLIASFEEEEFAIAITRSLFALKAISEIVPQPEARFVDIDMIVDELEEMDDEEEDGYVIETTKERSIGDIIYQNYFYIVCICVGYMIGLIIACLVF